MLFFLASLKRTPRLHKLLKCVFISLRIYDIEDVNYITKVHDDICFALVHTYSSLLILTKILSIFTFTCNKPFIYFGIQNTLEMKLIKQNKHNFLFLYKKVFELCYFTFLKKLLWYKIWQENSTFLNVNDSIHITYMKKCKEKRQKIFISD